MSMNVPANKAPIFVKEMKGAGEAWGCKDNHVNINDIANLHQISDNHWEADSISNVKNPDGSDTVYHFDDKTAQEITGYTA